MFNLTDRIGERCKSDKHIIEERGGEGKQREKHGRLFRVSSCHYEYRLKQKKKIDSLNIREFNTES
jgi:hypothetical protein